MLFTPNGPEHEAHLLSAHGAIRITFPIAAAIAIERLRLDAMTHRVP
jgi:hypothetical protein